MNKSRWLTQPGIRAETQTFADNQTETFHYRVRTPAELAAHFGALAALPQDGPGAVQAQALLTDFLAETLCDEAGAPILSKAEAALISPRLKNQLRDIIVTGSSTVVADLGKT